MTTASIDPDLLDRAAWFLSYAGMAGHPLVPMLAARFQISHAQAVAILRELGRLRPRGDDR